MLREIEKYHGTFGAHMWGRACAALKGDDDGPAD